MNAVTQHYIVDLSSNNNFFQVPAVQADGNETRYIELELIANNVPYVIDTTTTDVTIIGTKPDKTYIWNYCTVTQEGYVLVEITYQMAAAAGRCNYQIMLLEKGTNNALKTFPFYLIVTPSAYDHDTILSTNEFGFLIDMIEEVEQIDVDVTEAVGRAETAATNAETSAGHAATSETNAATSASNASTSATNAATSATNANTDALKAEGYAVGTQNGTPVSSGTYYENNAKYYCEESQESEEEAEAWAVGTRGGQPVDPSDPAYHNSAKDWAEAAAAIVGVDIATTTTPGIVMPDGDTITVAADGLIEAPSGKYTVNNKTLTLFMSATT